jgi:queuine tRNA-ribosyltransferase
VSTPEGTVHVVTTRNGATAMRDANVGEVMHPVIGPLLESEQLYVKPARLAERLSHPSASPLVLLDVGLGAGSNAVAAWRLALGLPPRSRRLSIVSFERDLSAFRLAAAAQHAAAFGLGDRMASAARALLDARACSSEGHGWRLVLGSMPESFAAEPAESADVVFWDPFSPRANPELWTLAAFLAVRRLCRQGVSLHTYSGATATRSALLLAGFAVGFGEPTGEKAETTVAALDARELDRPLDRRWLERLGRSSAPLPPDAPADALTTIARLPQFSER